MFGQRWKEVFEMEKVKREQLEAELKESRERLESDMELAYQDYQTQLLREGKAFSFSSRDLGPNT